MRLASDGVLWRLGSSCRRRSLVATPRLKRCSALSTSGEGPCGNCLAIDFKEPGAGCSPCGLGGSVQRRTAQLSQEHAVTVKLNDLVG